METTGVSFLNDLRICEDLGSLFLLEVTRNPRLLLRQRTLSVPRSSLSVRLVSLPHGDRHFRSHMGSAEGKSPAFMMNHEQEAHRGLFTDKQAGDAPEARAWLF